MKDDPREGLREQDLAIALLMMITNNIGQVAHLNAVLHKCSKVFFVGSFLRHNSISCRRLAFAINFWSKGAMEALFLEHEGYFGALGTFLQSAFGDDVDRMLTLGHRADRDKDKAGPGAATTLTLAAPAGVGRQVSVGGALPFVRSPMAPRPSTRAQQPLLERKRTSTDGGYDGLIADRDAALEDHAVRRERAQSLDK